ncbi:hypothetical protein KKC91_01405 [bacterium]|nr:hypothetical protein [bacterium]MBU1852856.1 hypothetical protein [Candidatus Omnitrophota bacterium]
MELSRKVFANYVAWFKTPCSLGGRGQWLHWDNNRERSCKHNPDKIDPTTGLRDIASVHYPLIGPYDSVDPNVIEYHIMLAQAAGIDGFIVEWFGKDDARDVDKATLVLRDKIKEINSNYGTDFRLLLAWEDSYAGGNKEEAISTLEYAWKNYMSDQSVYVWDEKKKAPILLVFPYFTGPRRSFRPGELLSIIDRLKICPVFSYHFPQVNEEGGFLNVRGVESIYAWVIAHSWDGTEWGKSNLDLFYDFLKGNKKNMEFAIAGCYPGFDDVGVGACWICNPKNKKAHRFIKRDSRKCNTYDLTWKRFWQYIESFESDKDVPVPWMQIVTWNDWNEGTEIEPSIDRIGREGVDYGFGYGYEYLKKTKEHVRAFKGISETPDEALYIPHLIYNARIKAKKNRPLQDAEQKLTNAVTSFFSGRYKDALSIIQTV